MGRWITLFGLLLSIHSFAGLPLDILYSAEGYGNTETAFQLTATVGDLNIIKAKDRLWAEVQYSDLAKSAELNIIPKQRVGIGTMPVVKLPYIGIKVDRLRPTTMYRARIILYSKDGANFTTLYTTPFYYTTTRGNDPKSLIRTAMVLKGLKEFSESEKGYVGENGTKFKDGTKYGADPKELWCSEFYAWVANPSLKGIAGASSVKKITAYFTKHNGMESPSQIPAVARRGDYVSMDTDGNGDANHSGMFLAFDKDDEGDFVWTLEGNSGNKVKVNRRPYDLKFFKGLGHIMNSQFQ